MDIGKTFSLLIVIFILLGFFFNFFGTNIKIPGDIYIERPGIRIYIPFISAIVISIIITIFFNFFVK